MAVATQSESLPSSRDHTSVQDPEDSNYADVACPTPPVSGNCLERLPVLGEHIECEGAVKIGSGNLGVVLLMHEKESPHRRLAVKIISLKLAKDNGHEDDRVWKEAQVMRDIDRHPNLVQLVDVLACWDRLPFVAADPPHICIAMEYVSDSEPLSNVLRRCGPSVLLATQVLQQLASALCSLHNRGLVHRDVWSENVLICEGSRRAVLVDLGCAEYSEGKPAINSKLNIPYMSPESAQGLSQAPTDDCWALGLLVTEMLTGRFIADRLGRSDLPIHYSLPALEEAVRDARYRGGPVLGAICSDLLNLSAAHRPAMSVVSARCPMQVQMCAVPTSSATPCWVRCPSRAVSLQSGQQMPIHAQPSGPAAMTTVVGSGQMLHQGHGGNGSFYPPHRKSGWVPVRARKAAASALVPSNSAGATLTPPPCFAAGPPPPLQQQQRQQQRQPQQLRDGCAVGPSLSSKAAQAVGKAVGSTPCYVVRSGPRARQGLPNEMTVCSSSSQKDTSIWQPGSPISADLGDGEVMLPVSTGRAMSSASTVAANSTSAVPTGSSRSDRPTIGVVGPGVPFASPKGMPYPVPVQTSPAVLMPELAPGLRIAYTARSNGQRYLGVIMHRLPHGWHLNLDVGEKKDVDDSEVWRICPVASG